ncbi:MAG: hypothetical protein WAW21_06015 [Corynebacterium variabile]
MNEHHLPGGASGAEVSEDARGVLDRCATGELHSHVTGGDERKRPAQVAADDVGPGRGERTEVESEDAGTVEPQGVTADLLVIGLRGVPDG